MHVAAIGNTCVMRAHCRRSLSLVSQVKCIIGYIRGHGIACLKFCRREINHPMQHHASCDEREVAHRLEKTNLSRLDRSTPWIGDGKRAMRGMSMQVIILGF
jgi:hypothetical protein